MTSDLVWVVMDGTQDWRILRAFEQEVPALCFAGSIVGNMSYAGTGDIRVFGRGDGYTELMVRQLPRQSVLAENIPVT